MIVGRAVGVPIGIVAGQAWECEPRIDPGATTTAPRPARCSPRRPWPALRRPASTPTPWRILGEKLGEAYQVADDIRDVAGDPREIGKPVGRDVALGRPSAALELGLDGALLPAAKQLVRGAIDVDPAVPGARRAARR